MAYVKLTALHRKRIVVSLMKEHIEKFNEGVVAIELKQIELATELYKHFLGDDFDALQQLPFNWFRESSELSFRIGYTTNRISFNLSSTAQEDRTKYMMPRFMDSYNGPKIAKSNPLAKRFVSLKKQREAVRTAQQKMRDEIFKVLDSHATAKQLIMAWPEIESTVHAAISGPTKPGIKASKQLTASLNVA